MFFGLLITIVFGELTLHILAHYSVNLRFFTTNPYQQTYLTEVNNWKGLVGVFDNEYIQHPGATLNGYVLNSHGFESPEYPYEKPAGTKRIVFLGDSQTVGETPYEQSFVRVLEKKLQATQTAVQLINLGVLCTGPGTYQTMLQYEGLRYAPDVVVVGFFVGNDFTDDKDLKIKYQEQKARTHMLPFWMYQSKILSLFRNSMKYFRAKSQSPLLHFDDTITYGKTTHVESESFTPFSMAPPDYIALEASKVPLFIPNSSEYSNWENIQTYLTAIQQLTTSIQAKLVVLIIPDEIQVNKTLVQEATQYENIQEDGLVMDLPQQTLKKFLTEQGIAFIDILEQWKTEQRPMTDGSYFFPRNTHLSFLGNASVADMLYPTIVSMLQTMQGQ